jgi:hypothetical protein
MPGNSYFLSLITDFNKVQLQSALIKQELKKDLEEEKQSPKTKERLRKNKSIEDFMKHQVPWII